MTSEIDIRSIIINADKHFIDGLFDIIQINMINIIKPPQTGLLMMAVQDSFDTSFYLGEILITEAEVEYNGLKGYAMLIGDDPKRSKIIAVISAIMHSDNEDLKKEIKKRIAEQMEKFDSLRRKESMLIAKTKVSFENMPKG